MRWDKRAIIAWILLGVGLMLPRVSLADEGGHTSVNATEIASPSSNQQTEVSEGDDSGVRSRAPSSGSLRSPAMLQLQKVPIPQETFVQMGPAPSNVTLTPVTPTSIRIEWSPSPGAVRYLISRNGAADIPIEANAGFFHPQTNRFGYMDVGREPAMLHTYSVTAQFNPPLLPSRSAAVQILTPHALPPQNFKATMSGPNAVTLNWTGRPEASGSYRIIRNGGNLPPTTLNASGVSIVDQNLPPGEYRYSIFSGMRLANGKEINGEFSNQITIKTRPFNIVAIGDSLMWGQGLSQNNKFAFKVAEKLKTDLGKSNVQVLLIAHSGAVTYPDPVEVPAENTSLPGEVPSRTPSIAFQISNLVQTKVPPGDVDLVLVDGCINNVGIRKILNPFTSESGLRDATRGYCNAGMQNILYEVARTFPHAKVIVNGYFPVVSRQSNLGSLVALWTGIGVVTGGLIPPDPIIGGAMIAGFRERAAALSDLFFQESTSSLQLAVNSVNALPPPLGGNRFRYAALTFGPQNSYAGSDSWLWLIPARGIVEDEAFHSRSRDCDTHQRTDLLCYGASMGHPNVAGAQAYTNAITSTAAQFLTEWRSAHVASLPAPENFLVIRAQPVFREPNGGTLVVTATGGVSGTALQGTVELNSMPAGAIGMEIRYAFQPSNPTEIFVKVDVPGHRSGLFVIPVRSQSVAVNLTNSADPRTAVVTASDAVTGQELSGTVIVQTPSSQISGPTGQPLTYSSCGQVAQGLQLANIQMQAGPVPCTGFVRVPHYPDASYQDVPGVVNYTLNIDKPANVPRLQRTPLK